MSVYLNPFLARASEQQRDVRKFVTTFGAGAIDILPEAIWDRLVILRSTPGAGKTSLMRVFTYESLDWVRRNLKSSDPIHKELAERGVINAHAPTKLGAYVSLDRGYRSLLDLPASEEQLRRLFFRLLDVRVLLAVMRSALLVGGLNFPDDAEAFRFSISADPSGEAIAGRLGGSGGDAVLAYARATERTLLNILDALVPVDAEAALDGHNELYSLRLLNDPITVSGKELMMQPLLLFDDGHELHRSQRDLLLRELRTRETSVARWYAERFEALSDQEILTDTGKEGRDYLLVDVDEVARNGSSDGRRFVRGRYEKVLADIARRRAAPVLVTYAQEHQEFLSLVEDASDQALNGRETEIVEALRTRTEGLASNDGRYDSWFKEARELTGWRAAVRWRELEIMIRRDQERQQELFDDSLGQADLEERSSPAVREGAALSVAREFGLPYYAGANIVTKLGSHNAEQFLSLCGDLFAEMLVDVSVGRQPRLDARRQHRVIKDASDRVWNAIPRTIPHGRDVQALVAEIVAIAELENSKPKMPYPPGVTGTALLMGERSQLLDGAYRQKTPGAERLFAALASAVAHNILTAELDYSVKNNRYMVLYVNRLLCPRFWLPLGYGSFRERRLHVVLDWMRKLPATGAPVRMEEPLPL